MARIVVRKIRAIPKKKPVRKIAVKKMVIKK